MFFRVAIFLSRPAIVGGVMLVFMEMLSDYGTAAYYGVETFSAGIFKLWFDMGDSYSASVLAGLLMMFVFVLMIFEQVNKNSKKYSFSTHDTSKFTQKRSFANSGRRQHFYVARVCFAWRLPFLLPGFCIGVSTS